MANRLLEIRGTYTSTTKGTAAFLERIAPDKLEEWLREVTENGSCVTIVEIKRV